MGAVNDPTAEDVEQVNIYIQGIEQCIDEFAIKYNIDDLVKMPQARWNALLRYTQARVFSRNEKVFIYSNSCSMDYDNDYIMSTVLNIYIELCNLYDKEVSIIGYSNFTGINTDSIYSWSNGNDSRYKLSAARSDIYKRLTLSNEESLSNMLITGNRNAVGILGALNRRHGWNMGQPRGIDGGKKQESIERIKEQVKLLQNETQLKQE